MQLQSASAIAEFLSQHPSWRAEDDVLESETTFTDFQAAMRFVASIAELAEEVAHHPDIDIRYTRVRLALTTHDAGGITERDFNFVQKIDQMRDPPEKV